MSAHALIAPVLLPLLGAALLLLGDAWRMALKRGLAIATAATVAMLAGGLLVQASGQGAAATFLYHPGGWPASFGIVLVGDRLALVMVCLAALLVLAAMVYAIARWDRADPRFHALFLLLLAGVNGAFLTGDIFNLFVFFEMLLAASYGLALNGGGRRRMNAGLHYITINIVASMLLLIAIAIVYGVTGTLNIAAIARLAPELGGSARHSFRLAAALLGVAFLTKAAIWPLGFWLTRTYAAAIPPVAAAFAIMTKVGVYVILRLDSLLPTDFAAGWLVAAGCMTMLFGTLSILSTQRLGRIAGHYLMVSSGTLIAGIGFGGAAMVAALLYYLLSATLAVAAFYLVAELVRRNRHGELLPDTAEPVFADEDPAIVQTPDTDTAMAIPATLAVLGGGFILATLLLAGLPPLSGFIAKFAIIDALLQAPAIAASHWLFIALIILSGLAVLVALTRAGIELLWTPDPGAPTISLRLSEVLACALLLGLALALVVAARPATTLLQQTAAQLADRGAYVQAVLGPAEPRP